MIRKMKDTDIDSIISLCDEEGWQTIVRCKESYKQALEKSICYVALNNNKLVGFFRAITDGFYTIFFM